MKLPKCGDFVICKITKVNPNSAFAFMEEYGIEGMIHVSEVANGWVRDIKKYLKEGQIVVARVVRINGNHISLSIKRVDKNQKRNKLKSYKNEKKAEKMLEIVAKQMRQTKNMGKIKDKIKDNFGSLYSCFESSIKNDELLKNIFDDKWIRVIKEVAKKNIQEREIEFKAKLKLKSYGPNGIEIIKKTLKQSAGLNITYLSAPEYLVKFKTKESKKGEREFNKKLLEITDAAKKNNCFESIEILK